MTGVEIDFVVKDCLAALPLYERIFDVVRVEATALPVGQNEAVFTVYGVRFHILDESPDYGLVAPKSGDPKPMWLNVLVEDIAATWDAAMAAGCAPIQPVTEMPAMGVRNAMFTDPFGYVWMLHQLDRVVSFEERVRLMTQEDAPKE